MKSIMLFLVLLAALVLPATNAVAQTRNTIVDLWPTEAAHWVTAPIMRFDPTKPNDDAYQIAAGQDSLRGPLATITTDTTLWIRVPNTLFYWSADTTAVFTIWARSLLGDTASIAVGIQFGVDGIPDTTAATTKIFMSSTWSAEATMGFAKASTTKGWAVSRNASWGLFSGYRGNNCFRLLIYHQKANNASAAMSQTNKLETFSVGAGWQTRAKQN